MRVLVGLLALGVGIGLCTAPAWTGSAKAGPDRKRPNPDRLRGMRAAVADVDAGKLVLRFPPYPASKEHGEYVALLEKELGVRTEVVADWDGALGRSGLEMGGYNDVMRVEIEHRFGRGALERLRKKAAGTPSPAPGRPAGYLKDGRLTASLTVVEMRGGSRGFLGTYWRIEPDGSWSSGEWKEPPVPPRKRPGARGKLSAEQLAWLAEELPRHDLATLPRHGRPVVNPKVIRVRFGGRVVELTGRPEPTTEDRAIRARYAGIVQAVKALCQPPKD